jgi:ferredoxin
VPPPLRHAPSRTAPGHTVIPSAPTRRPLGPTVRVDWPACKAHGLCHELLPERFGLDEWGYPVVDRTPLPPDLVEVAKRAVASCPTLALRLVDPPAR